ncbi:MAG: hypothetical protein LBT66_04285 [Methanobrevibacter sp.]|jgi:hypothetical protein|nr:hypothetical protein [Candidatus Methanovirga meridionalis]
MKLKLFSLVIIAVLIISCVGSVSALTTGTTFKGLGLLCSDGSTSDKVDVKAYDINNNLIGELSKKYDSHSFLVLPINTNYIDIDVQVWKVNGWLRNGHWNHVFSNRLSGNDITTHVNDYDKYDYKLSYTSIRTSGTVYASYANIVYQDWAYIDKSVNLNTNNIQLIEMTYASRLGPSRS